MCIPILQPDFVLIIFFKFHRSCYLGLAPEIGNGLKVCTQVPSDDDLMINELHGNI